MRHDLTPTGRVTTKVRLRNVGAERRSLHPARDDGARDARDVVARRPRRHPAAHRRRPAHRGARARPARRPCGWWSPPTARPRWATAVVPDQGHVVRWTADHGPGRGVGPLAGRMTLGSAQPIAEVWMTDGIATRLDGKHVLLTGVTGFVGEALLQLMLADVPGVRLTLLVRPKGSTSGAARIAALLRKPIFAGVRRGGRRGRGADGRAGDRARGRPGRRARRCPTTSTPWCTAPATCPSTRRSTRASAPTWSAPATLLQRIRTAGGTHRARRTTCTSRRRTSRAGAAAGCRRVRSSTRSTSTPRPPGAWPSGSRWSTAPAPRPSWSRSARRPSAPTAAPGCSPPPGRPRRRARSGSRTSWCGWAPSGPAAWAGPTATRSPSRSASAWSRRTRAPTRSPSSGRASSSPRWSAPTRAGSRASRWPSR